MGIFEDLAQKAKSEQNSSVDGGAISKPATSQPNPSLFDDIRMESSRVQQTNETHFKATPTHLLEDSLILRISEEKSTLPSISTDLEVNTYIPVGKTVSGGVGRYDDRFGENYGKNPADLDGRTASEKNEAYTRHNEYALAPLARMVASTSSGIAVRQGCLLAGLQNVPKIGKPLAIAAPFVVAGLTNSYLKTETLTDLKSIGEGAVVYAGVSRFVPSGQMLQTRAAAAAAVSPELTLTTRIRL